MTGKRMLAWITVGLAIAGACAAQTRDQANRTREALGSAAAVDAAGRVWVATVQNVGELQRIVLTHSADEGRTWSRPAAVTSNPEPVAADGENRPKLAFGPGNELYVSWTSPTSARRTGNIRFARSLDGGATWSVPVAVHRDRQMISHRFDSLLVDGEGRVWIAWLDKRDLTRAESAGQPYAGAAVYYTYSDDRGATWREELKLADHSCECCRIASALDPQGRPVLLWRHIFEPNERDHALALLTPPRKRSVIERVTFERWRVDACPHHGPALAIAAEGTRHAVWFNVVADQGRAFYGQLASTGPAHVRELPLGAAHADVAVAGSTVLIAWKRFDGSATRVETLRSVDGGRTFTAGPLLQTTLDSDQPRLIAGRDRLWLVWRRADGIVVQSMHAVRAAASGTAAPAIRSVRSGAQTPEGEPIRAFERTTLREIERRYRGAPFWVVLWDLECPYCMKSLSHLAAAQRADATLRVVTIATDPISSAVALSARLAELGVKGEAYAFAADVPEALRFAIDPAWGGEKPRAYFYSTDGRRRATTGVLTPEHIAQSR